MTEAYAYPESVPWLRANMIASLDGAISYKGNTSALGNQADRDLMACLRGLADVVILGASTAREYASPFPAGPALAIVSHRLDLDFDGPLIGEARTRPIIITCAASPEERRRAAERHADVLLSGDDQVELAAALDLLAARGHRRQLSEGGPKVLAQIAAAGRLDELCLTLSPRLVAGEAARVLDGPVMDARPMVLGHAIQEGDYLFLRYVAEHRASRR